MKKLFLLAVVMLVSVTTFAQDGKWAAGVNIGYGSDISKPSIGVKALYDINNSFTVSPSFNYYFQEKEEGIKLNYWDLNCDLHWNVVSNDNFKFYPLAGITYLNAKASYGGDSESEGKFGANIGLGGQLNLGSHWATAVEVKYQVIDGSQVVPSLSLMYRF